ncbi:MAG: ammonia channel protein, partial [Rhodomicrobium sp.]
MRMKMVWRNLALLGAAALGAAAIIHPALAEEAVAAAGAAAAAAPKAPDLVVNKADDGWMMVSSL